MPESEKPFGHPIATESAATETKASTNAAKAEVFKSTLIARFMELLQQGQQTNPGVTWGVASWGGIRGTHPEYTGRLSPLGFVVWAVSGTWPSIIRETDELDKLGFETVSSSLGDACENFDDEDAGKNTMRRKILKRIR